jgi:hypothetical protein
MVVFDTSPIGNVTSLVELFRFADRATNSTSILGFTLLAMVFIILFGLTIKYGSDRALAYASFTCFALSLLLYFTDFIAKGVVVFMILLVVLSVFWMTGKRRDEEGNI